MFFTVYVIIIACATAMEMFTGVTDTVTRIRTLEGNIMSEQSISLPAIGIYANDLHLILPTSLSVFGLKIQH